MPSRLFGQRFHALVLMPRGVRLKLLWSFLLMSAVPLVMLLLVAGWFAFPTAREFYHLERWFPLITDPTGSVWWLLGLLALTIVVSLLGGLYLTVKLVEPVIQISHDAKQLAREAHEEPSSGPSDELVDLTSALNRLTTKIRDNMTELKQFGERTNQINLEIHKRVIMFSGLLQVGELISNGTELDVVLDLVVEKLAVLDDKSFSFLCLQPLEDFPLTLRRAHQLDVKQLNQLVFESSEAVIDEAHAPTEEMQEVWEQLGRPNLILQPVIVRNRHVGLLGLGNHRAAATWPAERLDLVSVFVKQTSIAIENELLMRKTKALAIRDELTGVYNEGYIRQRLSEEIQRAVMYQRPCAFAMFSIQGFQGYRQRRGEPEAERAMKKIARLIQDSVSEIDRVGRFNGNEIVIVLPERNKRQALDLVEEVRQRVALAFAGTSELEDRLTLVGGVSENPLDGIDAEELIEKAGSMIREAAMTAPKKRV